MPRPPTGKQMLILADRAERGRLTADEAARLRAGIRAMEFARQGTTHRLAEADRLARQMAAVANLLRGARARQSRTVSVWALGQVLAAAQRPTASTTKELT